MAHLFRPDLMEIIANKFDVQKPFGYDYVLDNDFANPTYSIFKLIEGVSQVETAYFSQNSGSNPLRYCYDGETEPAGNLKDLKVINYTEKLSSDKVGGLLVYYHYAATFDLGFLKDCPDFTGNFTAHFTMGCGNDDLMGQGTIDPVPETGNPYPAGKRPARPCRLPQKE